MKIATGVKETCKHEHFANVHTQFQKSSQMWTFVFSIELESQAMFFQSKARLAVRGNILTSDLWSSWLRNTIVPLLQRLVHILIHKEILHRFKRTGPTSVSAFKTGFRCSSKPHTAIHLSIWNRGMDLTASLYLIFVFTMLLPGPNAEYLTHT